MKAPIKIRKPKLRILFSVLLPLIINSSYAQNLPNALLYKNKAIDPLCIYEAENSTALISLDKCGINAQPNRKITGVDNDFTQKGYVGFNYTWSADKPDDALSKAFSYYKVIGNIDDNYIVYTFNYTGGSGNFSGIYLLKRENDSLKVTSLASGDRCNGGINEVHQQGSKIIYTIHITPADFFELANQKPNHISLNDNLTPCAICCVGTATLELDPLKVAEGAKFISIDLGARQIEIIDRQNKYRYCFDILVTDYQRQGKRILDAKALNEFIEKFKGWCE